MLLQANGRQHNTEIASRLGVAEATVRKRIERLLREKIFQVGAWTDPLRVGYQHWAVIEVQVNPPDIEKVAEALAALPETFFVGICTGVYDILVGALFRSSEHMYEMITKRLAQIPGIIRTVTSNVIRIVKREYTHPIPLAQGGLDDTDQSDERILRLRRRGRRVRRPRPSHSNKGNK